MLKAPYIKWRNTVSPPHPQVLHPCIQGADCTYRKVDISGTYGSLFINCEHTCVTSSLIKEQGITAPQTSPCDLFWSLSRLRWPLSWSLAACTCSACFTITVFTWCMQKDGFVSLGLHTYCSLAWRLFSYNLVTSELSFKNSLLWSLPPSWQNQFFLSSSTSSYA